MNLLTSRYDTPCGQQISPIRSGGQPTTLHLLLPAGLASPPPWSDSPTPNGYGDGQPTSRSPSPIWSGSGLAGQPPIAPPTDGWLPISTRYPIRGQESPANCLQPLPPQPAWPWSDPSQPPSTQQSQPDLPQLGPDQSDGASSKE